MQRSQGLMQNQACATMIFYMSLTTIFKYHDNGGEHNICCSTLSDSFTHIKRHKMFCLQYISSGDVLGLDARAVNKHNHARKGSWV